ncbi:hypothetical protein GOV08_01485 [Candidatus Woesearchaeota archaeon]|nr:hypothetical protein [Candidatus Woesearchaeota archaeon]
MNIKNKTIVGLTEEIKIKNSVEKNSVMTARIDTGATNSSIDINIAGKLNLGPIIKTKLVKSTHGKRLRPVIEMEIEVADKKIKGDFTLADRSHMRYPILIGQNILKDGFLIDPNFVRSKKK